MKNGYNFERMDRQVDAELTACYLFLHHTLLLAVAGGNRTAS